MNSGKLTVVLFVLFLCMMLNACDTKESVENTARAKPESSSKTKLTVFHLTRMSAEGIIEDIVKEFKNANTDIDVEYSQSSNEYESLMKIKMASHDMPDVFATHGWAIRRYGDFLADLSKEEWAPRVKESIKPFVTDKNGKLYVLPMDEDRTGIIFNAEILDKYVISPPATFDQLEKALETIKVKSNGSIVPMYIAGDDRGQIGNFFDYYSTSLFITPKKNYAKQFVDGTFDWGKYDVLAEKLLELKKKGFINENMMAARYYDLIDSFASGKVAFVASHPPSIVSEAKKTNPKLRAGIIPIPTMSKDGEVFFVNGERTTWGVWKDSPHINEAKKFVAYFARPENVKRVAEASMVPAGLMDANEDLGELASYYKKYANVKTYTYFDREYLPSGMWEIMCNSGQDLVAGKITPRQFSQRMEEEYKRLKGIN